MLESNSQAGQDKFILSLFKNDYKGTFVDVGCSLPKHINNTLLLEENNWTGISVDIENFSEQWKIRKTPFIHQDALTCEYNELFKKHGLPKVIDYLSLDIEGEGLRYLALKKVMESGYEFKVMTVEHDVSRGNVYDLTERIPQRKFLTELGYVLLCADVSYSSTQPYEDWWINPKYMKESDYIYYKCSSMVWWEILKLKK